MELLLLRKVGIGYWESLRWQLGKSAAGMPATMLSVRNIASVAP
jgi:hypothetical protein